MSFYKRRKEISDYYLYTEEYLRMIRGYSDVNIRLVVKPAEKLVEHGFLPIYATVEDINNEINQGYGDGLRVVEAYHREQQLKEQERNN